MGDDERDRNSITFTRSYPRVALLALDCGRYAAAADMFWEAALTAESCEELEHYLAESNRARAVALGGAVVALGLVPQRRHPTSTIQSLAPIACVIELGSGSCLPSALSWQCS